MDFNAIIESLTAIVRHSGSAVVVYAVVVCILTEIVKKLFIPKLKIDLLNKFDPTIIVPFALGCAASVFHSLAVQGVDLSSAFENVLVNGLTIGATSTVLYRMFVSVFCENVKKLKKDEIFNLFYTEIFVYSDIKEKLLDGQTTMKDFVSEVKLVSEKAVAIYQNAETDGDEKKQKLVSLMSGLIDDSVIFKAVEPIHNAMLKTFETTATA